MLIFFIVYLNQCTVFTRTSVVMSTDYLVMTIAIDWDVSEVTNKLTSNVSLKHKHESVQEGLCITNNRP